jgi:hypothetical protein
MWRRGVFTFLGVLLIAGPAGAVDPGPKCEADKLKEAGKYGFCRLKAESKYAKTGNALKYAQDLEKCDTKYSEKWGKAETKAAGDCPTSGDEAAMQEQITSDADAIAVCLSGTCPPTCSALPPTGQTTAYKADKNDGDPNDVAVPDDGTVQAGGALAYMDNGDGTITDLNTGLMWEKKSDDGGLHDKDDTYRWSGDGSQETIWDWLDDVNAEGGSGFAGYSDWRIPNVKELHSILDYERYEPSVDPAFNTGCGPGCTVTNCSCTDISSGYYWSSSSSREPGNAWLVNFVIGYVVDGNKEAGAEPVRAVRGP